MNDNNLTLIKSNIVQDPFDPAPVESQTFFLLTPALQNHTNTLINIAKSGTSIGLVKGDPGSGKTSLANYLAERLQQESNLQLWKIHAQSDTELISALAKEAGMSDEALGNEPRKRFIEHLTQLRGSGTTVVLIIDDAHLLTPQALHLVIRLGLSPASGQNGLMHTLMFAESDIEGRLWLSAITDPLPLDRLYTLVLPALNAEQTYAYLKHRLKVAGYPEGAVFSQADANSIHRKAEGLPGMINELARRRLGRQPGGRTVSTRIMPAMTLPRRSAVTAFAGLMVVAAGAALLWWYVDPAATFVQSDENIVSAPSSVTQESASLFATATQQESLLTLPQADSTLALSEQQSPLASPKDALRQFSQPATTAPDSQLQQQNYPSVDTGTYSIQETTELLITPSTPDSPPVPEEALPGPPASPKADATPEAFSSALSQHAGIGDKRGESGIKTTPQTGVVEAPRTPVDEASPKKIEDHILLPTTDTAAAVSDSAIADSPSTRNLVKMPEDKLVDQPLRASEAANTPSMPALTKPEEEPAILAANLPPRQPVAVAKPLTDNGRTQLDIKNKVQQSEESSGQAEKTKPESADQTTDTPSGQRIALNSVRREPWLKQRRPAEYAVQIMSGPNEAGLRQFIARNRFPTTPSYYRARDGRYKLVLPYPDEHQARQALKALPETLQLHGQPWIRSMADVQKDML